MSKNIKFSRNNYKVNVRVTKTVVRDFEREVLETTEETALKAVKKDIEYTLEISNLSGCGGTDEFGNPYQIVDVQYELTVEPIK